MDTLIIIKHFYPETTPLYHLLLRHSQQVQDKAMNILDNLKNKSLSIDNRLVKDGAMLHDIGIFRCYAPSILCKGSEPYITHGIIGAQLLREYGKINHLDLEKYARICERHTGSGLTKEDIFNQSLPLPIQDYLPETNEEKLICLADKFFSKSGNLQEKPLKIVQRSMAKFGPESLARFDDLCRLFEIE